LTAYGLKSLWVNLASSHLHVTKGKHIQADKTLQHKNKRNKISSPTHHMVYGKSMRTLDYRFLKFQGNRT